MQIKKIIVKIVLKKEFDKIEINGKKYLKNQKYLKNKIKFKLIVFKFKIYDFEFNLSNEKAMSNKNI